VLSTQVMLNELYKLARTGDCEAEQSLFRDLTVRFLAFTKLRVREKEEAEDIVQDALSVICSRYATMDFAGSFTAWSYEVLKNHIRNHMSKQSRRRRLDRRNPRDEVQPATWRPDVLLESRLIECLRRICATNARYARVLNLSHQGYSMDEICSRLGITKNNSYVLLSRARSMLERCLQDSERTK